KACRLLPRCSGSIQCSIRFGMIRVSKNCARKNSSENTNCTKRHEFQRPSTNWSKAVSGAEGRDNIEGKAATGSGEQAGVRASFKLVSRVCEKCGSEIPTDAPEGGCPGCLLESGLRLLEQESVAVGKGGSASPKTINAFGLPAEAPAQAGERVPPHKRKLAEL